MWSTSNNAKVRKAERTAVCRHCDEDIKRGEEMLTMYSWRNQGQYIHFHLGCVETLYRLVEEAKRLKNEVESLVDLEVHP